MKVVLNPDAATVAAIREGLKRTGGYCPCRLQQTEDTKCMCTEFREQMADPAFEGFCHCLLYFKALADDPDEANARALAAAMALGFTPTEEEPVASNEPATSPSDATSQPAAPSAEEEPGDNE